MTAGQLRAFEAACLKRGLDTYEEKQKAAKAEGVAFSDFTFDQASRAIQRINATPGALSEEEKREQIKADYEKRQRIACERSRREADLAHLEMCREAFGSDYELVLQPIVYAIRRPASRKWIEGWLDAKKRETLEERREALFELLATFAAEVDLTAEISKAAENREALDALRSMTFGGL